MNPDTRTAIIGMLVTAAVTVVFSFLGSLAAGLWGGSVATIASVGSRRATG